MNNKIKDVYFNKKVRTLTRTDMKHDIEGVPSILHSNILVFTKVSLSQKQRPNLYYLFYMNSSSNMYIILSDNHPQNREVTAPQN